jgi:RNA polymerase sigma-70 factor (ECF subfamily)
MLSADRNSESQLALELMEGVPGAFDRFVEHFRTRVFQYSYLTCGQREDAEEVAQETLLKVFESMDQLRDPGRIRSWVFRIAKNACLMKRRKSVFAPAKELSLDELMPTRSGGSGGKIEIADWSRLPEDQMLQTEMKSALSQAIAALPEMYRSVVLLRDLEELSTQEAAQILGVSEDVVKTRLHRGRLAIRKALDARLRPAASHVEARVASESEEGRHAAD